MWMGPEQFEGVAAYQRAIAAGMTQKRAMSVGQVGSFRNCWVFRSSIAKHVSCSVRTVARALAQAAELGLLGRARGKKGEIPPGRTEPVTCGFSHRWIIGRGAAGGAAVKAAVEDARAAWQARKLKRIALKTVTPQPDTPVNRQKSDTRRRWTAAELDAALALIPAADPPE